MRVQFLKDEKITFVGNEIVEIKVGDLVDIEKINKVSPTLLNYYLTNKIVKTEEEKSINPVVENKSINPVVEVKIIEPTKIESVEIIEEEKDDLAEELSEAAKEEIKKELRKKGIAFHPRVGLKKLKELNNNKKV